MGPSAADALGSRSTRGPVALAQNE